MSCEHGGKSRAVRLVATPWPTERSADALSPLLPILEPPATEHRRVALARPARVEAGVAAAGDLRQVRQPRHPSASGFGVPSANERFKASNETRFGLHIAKNRIIRQHRPAGYER